MSTPNTVGAISRSTPFNDQRLVLRAAEQQTPSTVRLNYSNYSAIVSWSSVDPNRSESGHEQSPTFDACSTAIMTAVERMVLLGRQPRSLAVAIAYDECMDIITAAIAHMEQIEAQGGVLEGFLDVYRAMRNVRETLRPSSVRRSLF